jgi:hypothetical protein
VERLALLFLWCSEIENILIGRENKTIRQAVKDKRNVIVQYIWYVSNIYYFIRAFVWVAVFLTKWWWCILALLLSSSQKQQSYSRVGRLAIFVKYTTYKVVNQSQDNIMCLGGATCIVVSVSYWAVVPKCTIITSSKCNLFSTLIRLLNSQ